MTDLSILIPSVHTRWNTFARQIQSQIYDQYNDLRPEDQARVEILFWSDNKTMTIGEKRNRMVEAARGRYVTFIDDDDKITKDYTSALLTAIAHSDADVITFEVSVRLNGGSPKICKYSKYYPNDFNTHDGYYRLPNHIMCVKKELAFKAGFQNKNFGEDAEYARALKPFLETEYPICRVLYHYDFNSGTTETQR